MNTGKREIVTGGVILATLAGAAVAGVQYRNRFRIYKREYDIKTVEEFTGKVEQIVNSDGENGQVKGVEIIVDTGEELRLVHLGPSWFIEHQQEKIKSGQKVTVKGSKIIHNNVPIVVAKWIKRGNEILKLRSEKGEPIWNAWTSS